MTQFPENPSAGDEPEPRDDAWDEPQRAGLALPYRRAARAVWLLGTVEALVFGYLTLAALALATLSEADLRQALADAPDPAVVDMIVQQRWLALPAAAAVALFGLIPGIAYIVLGFFVRNARKGAVNFALLIVVTQAIVVGVLLLAAVLGSILEGDPSALTLNILILGTPMALLVYAGLKLMQARAFDNDPVVGGNDVEPWNRQW